MKNLPEMQPFASEFNRIARQPRLDIRGDQVDIVYSVLEPILQLVQTVL